MTQQEQQSITISFCNQYQISISISDLAGATKAMASPYNPMRFSRPDITIIVIMGPASSGIFPR